MNTEVFRRVNAMNKKLKLILILVCVVMAFTGVVIVAVVQEQGNLKERTVIELNGETNKTLKTELTGFYPGSEREYKIILRGEASENYETTLNFRSDKSSGALENYIIVTITTKGVTIKKQLKELLDGEKAELGKNASEITITYAMPENTGNEAQGTTADFYIDFTAKNDK